MPVIGYDTVGGSELAGGNLVIYTGPESVAAASGAITAIHIAYASNITTEGVKVAVANCVQNPAFADPEGFSLIAEGSDTLVAASSNDHTIANLTPIADVVAGTYYAYGVTFEFSTSSKILFDTFGTQATFYYTKNFPLEMKDPVPVTTNQFVSRHCSIWAEYGAAAATFNRSRIVNMGAIGPQNRSTIANA